jgi:hypothetical protein
MRVSQAGAPTSIARQNPQSQAWRCTSMRATASGQTAVPRTAEPPAASTGQPDTAKFESWSKRILCATSETYPFKFERFLMP